MRITRDIPPTGPSRLERYFVPVTAAFLSAGVAAFVLGVFHALGLL